MRKWSPNEYVSMPWKNGGGITTELAVFPAGAALDQFIWRLSTAQVNQDGPFSYFQGIDRTLAVLSGDGLILHSDAGQVHAQTVVLTTDSRPYRFSGETAISAELLNQRTVFDLNMMTRRDVCSHYMQRLQAGSHLIEAGDAQQLLLYCLHGELSFPRDEKLTGGELLLLEEKHEHEGISLRCEASEGTEAVLIFIQFLNMGQS